jgi:hypothetical protein
LLPVGYTVKSRRIRTALNRPGTGIPLDALFNAMSSTPREQISAIASGVVRFLERLTALARAFFAQSQSPYLNRTATPPASTPQPARAGRTS